MSYVRKAAEEYVELVSEDGGSAVVFNAFVAGALFGLEASRVAAQETVEVISSLYDEDW